MIDERTERRAGTSRWRVRWNSFDDRGPYSASTAEFDAPPSTRNPGRTDPDFYFNTASRNAVLVVSDGSNGPRSVRTAGAGAAFRRLDLPADHVEVKAVALPDGSLLASIDWLPMMHSGAGWGHLRNVLDQRGSRLLVGVVVVIDREGAVTHRRGFSGGHIEGFGLIDGRYGVLVIDGEVTPAMRFVPVDGSPASSRSRIDWRHLHTCGQSEVGSDRIFAPDERLELHLPYERTVFGRRTVLDATPTGYCLRSTVAIERLDGPTRYALGTAAPGDRLTGDLECDHGADAYPEE